MDDFDNLIGKKSKDRNNNKNSKKDNSWYIINILKKNILELFTDQLGDTYAAVRIKDHIIAIPTNSGRFRDWIIKTCYEYKKLVQTTNIENSRAITILGNEEAAKYQTIIRLEAEEQRNKRRLEIRVAGSVDSGPNENEDGNIIYYDLCNEDGEIIKATRNGWEVIKHGGASSEKARASIIVFKHSKNQLPQQRPIKEYPSDILAQFLNLTNLPSEDKENRLLAEVYVISLFLPPDIAKPILLPYGEQGSAKSTFQEFIKDLVDPSGALTFAFPRNITEIVQQLSHNYVAYYDNVSSLPDWISDVLCRAVTGSGFSKRMLYTDDDDFTYQFKRCVGFNGINIAATKPDILERGLSLHLKRIPDNKRRKLAELWKQYRMIKPQLLGFIFDILVNVLNRLKEVQLMELPRMADWAEIGEVISRCLGHSEDAFIKAYNMNLAKQNEHALEASPTATAMIRLMEKRMTEGFTLSECIGGVRYFEGSMTDLLLDLKEIADCELGIDIKDKKSWPQSPQALGNKLNEAATNLREIGIVIERPDNKSSHTKSVILIQQEVGNGELETMSLESFPANFPSENGQVHAQFAQKPGNGKLGDLSMSVGDKKEKDEGSGLGAAIPPGVPASSPSSPVSRFDENYAQIASDIDGKLDGEVGAHASSSSPLDDAPLVVAESNTVEIMSIDKFFYDDQTLQYKPFPDHSLEQSPCYNIIDKKENYFYCKLHPGIRNIHLESIEHHIKYKEPEVHRTELLRLES